MNRQPVMPTDALQAMCIDDSDFERLLNDRVLRRSGAYSDILHYACAKEALAYLKTAHRPPDVIFLDINMPIMSGFGFLDAATRDLGDAFTSRVVIMLTSSLNPDDRLRAEKYAAVKEFLSKPLTEEKACMVAQGVYDDAG